MTRRIFIDTEWTAVPWSEQSELMWIGLADEDGNTWYGISADVEIDPPNNSFISGAFKLISPDEERLNRDKLAKCVIDFCGDVNEFWAWIPELESFAQWFKLGEEAAEIYAKYWNTDLQMIQGLVQPWPTGWPTDLCNLKPAAIKANVEFPPRAKNHLHPKVHAEWNRELFKRIQSAQSG